MIVAGDGATAMRRAQDRTHATVLQLLAISGSVRRASFNTALLRAAIELAPKTCVVELASIREVPIYDGDYEAEHGIPEPVRQLKRSVCQRRRRVDFHSGVQRQRSRSAEERYRLDVATTRRYRARVTSGNRLDSSVPLRAWAAHASRNKRCCSPFASSDVRLFSSALVYVPQAGSAFDAEGKLTDEKAARAAEEVHGRIRGFRRRQPAARA